MYAYITILNGKRSGTHFPLPATGETLIGRGGTCQIALADPVSSRVHAKVKSESGAWVVRDNGSRNGTYVNGQKVAEATLGDGHVLRIGSTELQFSETEEPPTAVGESPLLTQTIVHEESVIEGGIDEASLDGLPNSEQVKELMLLYQLCIKLLGSGDPEELIHTSIDLLHKRTGATVVGLLWKNDEGELRPKMLYPYEAREHFEMSPSLTDLVSQAGHAVWVANQEGSESKEIGQFSDAICVPLISRKYFSGSATEEEKQKATQGALHAYLKDGRFRQSDFDFVISVANLLIISLSRALEMNRLQLSLSRLVQQNPGYDELIGESEPMLELKSKITRVSNASGAVLIRGESGAGKELVARAIHQASPRVDRPMVSVNCAAIPAELMESQLFGHKAGSFTSADRDHVGYFQQADMGTLFLDEVGELTPEGQAKLLRVLEGHPFLPVGATEPVTVDVRVLAATNQDLQTYVREKKFREDLYYRLSVFELSIPPLRERGGDIERLIEFFFNHFRAEHGRPHLKISDAAMQQLLSYNWPGNVRQLRNVIDSAVVMANEKEITPSALALRDASGSDEIDSLKIEDWERKLIVEALGRTKGNIPEAAKLLGIGRATLYRKVEQYGIDR